MDHQIQIGMVPPIWIVILTITCAKLVHNFLSLFATIKYNIVVFKTCLILKVSYFMFVINVLELLFLIFCQHVLFSIKKGDFLIDKLFHKLIRTKILKKVRLLGKMFTSLISHSFILCVSFWYYKIVRCIEILTFNISF